MTCTKKAHSKSESWVPSCFWKDTPYSQVYVDANSSDPHVGLSQPWSLWNKSIGPHRVWIWTTLGSFGMSWIVDLHTRPLLPLLVPESSLLLLWQNGHFLGWPNMWGEVKVKPEVLMKFFRNVKRIEYYVVRKRFLFWCTEVFWVNVSPASVLVCIAHL